MRGYGYVKEEYKGKKSGSLGDAAAVSFFPGKNLGAFGDAGMVLTNDAAIAETLRILRNQGNKKKYLHLALGYNHRMDTLQAAVLKVKLPYLDAANRKRQENAAFFSRSLRSLALTLPYTPEYTTHIYHQFVLRLSSGSEKLIQHLLGKGIDSRVYYPVPLHLQPCFGYLGGNAGDFPESEKASQETLAIPVFPELTNEELAYIVDSIKEFFNA
jgi:dTDP-4-amino-4,6-dideoxygalactose transaminase